MTQGWQEGRSSSQEPGETEQNRSSSSLYLSRPASGAIFINSCDYGERLSLSSIDCRERKTEWARGRKEGGWWGLQGFCGGGGGKTKEKWRRVWKDEDWERERWKWRERERERWWREVMVIQLTLGVSRWYLDNLRVGWERKMSNPLSGSFFSFSLSLLMSFSRSLFLSPLFSSLFLMALIAQSILCAESSSVRVNRRIRREKMCLRKQTIFSPLLDAHATPKQNKLHTTFSPPLSLSLCPFSTFSPFLISLIFPSFLNAPNSNNNKFSREAIIKSGKGSHGINLQKRERQSWNQPTIQHNKVQ